MIKLYEDHIPNPIMEMQHYLREISKYRPEIPVLNPDGIYDSKTKESVTKFQEIYGLPTTGIVDMKTWNVLVDEYSKYINTSNAPNKVSLFPDIDLEVKLGDEIDIVYVIQILLKNFRRKYKNYNTVDINGRYNQETEDAVKQFQNAAKLPATGIVDKITWNALTHINDTCNLYKY